jgi:nuclease HARBI1
MDKLAAQKALHQAECALLIDAVSTGSDVEEEGISEDDTMLLYAAYQLRKKHKLLHAWPEPPPKPVRRTVSIASFSEMECDTCFRFQKCDLPRVLKALRLPLIVKPRNGSTYTDEEAMLVLLRRLAYPQRLVDIEREYGRTYDQWSNLLTYMFEHVFENFLHLIQDNVDFFVPRFPAYCKAIAEKCNLVRLPAPIVGFIDGTVRPTCRPIDKPKGIGRRTHDLQRRVFSGHKRVHGLKYQGIVLPDGIIMDMAGPFPARRNDAYLLSKSEILPRMARAHRRAVINHILYTLFGDAAYVQGEDHLTSGVKGINLSEDDKRFNTEMSRVREAIEWAFDKIVQEFAFVDFKKNLKILLQPVATIYLVATILTNFHTCLYASQTSAYFGVIPPTLEEYASVPE